MEHRSSSEVKTTEREEREGKKREEEGGKGSEITDRKKGRIIRKCNINQT